MCEVRFWFIYDLISSLRVNKYKLLDDELFLAAGDYNKFQEYIDSHAPTFISVTIGQRLGFTFEANTSTPAFLWKYLPAHTLYVTRLISIVRKILCSAGREKFRRKALDIIRIKCTFYIDVLWKIT